MTEKKRTTKKSAAKKTTGKSKPKKVSVVTTTKKEVTVVKKKRATRIKKTKLNAKKRVVATTPDFLNQVDFVFAQNTSPKPELCFFQTPDHMGIYERDVDIDIFSEYAESEVVKAEISPELSDTLATAGEVETQVDNSQQVVTIRRQPHTHAAHILDLTGALQNSLDTVESDLHNTHQYDNWRLLSSDNKIPYQEHIEELTVVVWFSYIRLFFSQILQAPFRAVIKSYRFTTQSFIEYIQNIGLFIRLAVHGKLTPEALIDPDAAFVDLDFFDKNPTKRIMPLQLAPNAIAIKSLVLFLILSSVLVLPVKGMAVLDGLKQEQATVLGASETAYASLEQALTDIQQFSWLTASDHFEDSEEQFTVLYTSLQDSPMLQNALLKYIPSAQKRVETAEHLAQVGIEVSDLGKQITLLLDMLNTSDDTITLTTKIRLIQQTVDHIHAIESRIYDHFTHIDVGVLPDDIAVKVALLQDVLPHVTTSLDQIDGILDFAYILLGGDKQQRYVLVFQNSDELRPSGGFMGSLTTATIYQGKIINQYTPGGGPYDWQGWLSDVTRAPKPLWLVNPIWQFQDANWYADFPTSAESILSFYSQIEPEHVDGVIAINSYVLPGIIELLGGEIQLPAYNKIFTPENVLYELQLAVELEYDREENKPKKIIGDLFAELTNRLMHDSSIELIDLLDMVNEHLLNRDIQMYFKDPVLQEQARAWQWSGHIVEAPGDYLMIVHANIGGAKTDKYITEHSTLVSVLSENQNPTNTLTISRTNNGIAGDVFYGHNNVSYTQVYVPKGSVLIQASGDFEKPQEKYFEMPPLGTAVDALVASHEASTSLFSNEIEVFEAFGKTVFGFWMQTNLDETNTVVLEYTVPTKPIDLSDQTNNRLVEKIDDVLTTAGVLHPQSTSIWHSLYWQRQSGNNNHTIEYTLQYPSTWALEHALRPGFVQDGIITYEGLLEHDISAGFLFGY